MYSETTVPACSEKDLYRWWHEGPGGGDFAVSDQEFASLIDARVYFLTHLREGQTRAVRIGDLTRSFEYTKIGQRMKARVERLRESLTALDHDIINRVRSSEFTTKGCRNCGSQIARDFIGLKEDARHPVEKRLLDLYCPVCGALYLPTLTEQEKYQKLREALSIARNEYDDSRADYNDRHKDQGFWYVYTQS